MSPVQSWGHVQYWENSDTLVAPLVVTRPGYPTWQSVPLTMVLGFGLGGAEPIWTAAIEQLQWAWRLFRIICQWNPERKRALEEAIEAFDSPLYPHAVRAIRMTAVLPGMNDPQAWKAVANKLATSKGWAENTWRHLNACHEFERMIRAEDSTITNPARTLIVELAYQQFGRHAVGSTQAA